MSTKLTLKKYITKYIDKNRYLFSTDDAYVINCQLKPRIVSKAVENGFYRCTKENSLSRDEKDPYYQKLFNYGMCFAIKYINKE